MALSFLLLHDSNQRSIISGLSELRIDNLDSADNTKLVDPDSQLKGPLTDMRRNNLSKTISSSATSDKRLARII